MLRTSPDQWLCTTRMTGVHRRSELAGIALRVDHLLDEIDESLLTGCDEEDYVLR